MAGNGLGVTSDLVRDDQVTGPELVAKSTGHPRDQYWLLTSLLKGR